MLCLPLCDAGAIPARSENVLAVIEISADPADLKRTQHRERETTCLASKTSKHRCYEYSIHSVMLLSSYNESCDVTMLFFR